MASHPTASHEKKSPTKKAQIIACYKSGKESIEEIARCVQCRPSYVANVLQEEGYIRGYFDLYTSSAQSMNVYSTLFANRLGFKTENIAKRSVAFIDRWYRRFAVKNDRMGQHHALVVALTMFHRARWMNKIRQADIFRLWIIRRLQEEAPA